MTQHLIAVTLDTDPDGLTAATYDRETLDWSSTERAFALHTDLASVEDSVGAAVPITWFIRVDQQVRQHFDSALHLFDGHREFWLSGMQRGDELGWHPHLYHLRPDGNELVTDSATAVAMLQQIWDEIAASDFDPSAFRNGEGWHTPETYAAVEAMGFELDSTAIPGRDGGPGHPMAWRSAPTQPYFPADSDLQRPGPVRKCLQTPMATWLVRASYDPEPKLRYLNPAIHEELFDAALARTLPSLRGRTQPHDRDPAGARLWVLITHPDEVYGRQGADDLYPRSAANFARNLQAFCGALEHHGDTVLFTSLSAGAAQVTPLTAGLAAATTSANSRGAA